MLKRLSAPMKNLFPLLFFAATFLTASAHRIQAKEPDPFKVLTYNVLYGFNFQKSTDLGAQWIKGQHADLVALQEMTKYTQVKLTALAKKWGHQHSVILKENGFPVCLTANSPIEVIEKRVEDMWHGYLHCKVRGVNIFVVHLSPSKHDVRVKEAGILCAKVKLLLAADQRVIIMGDFNCNSPLDRDWLEAQPSTQEWRAKLPGNADPGYLTMSQFHAAGLYDLVHEKCPTAQVRLGTFSTRIKKQDRPGDRWRIDFILTDPTLALRCINADTPRDPVLHKISDHFPVQATFR